MATNASDLVNGSIEVGTTGLVIDDRFRIRGALYIEKQSGKGLVQFVEEMGDVPSFGDICLIITALVLQKTPFASIGEIEEKLNSLELTEIKTIFDGLKILEYEPKNSLGPEPETPEAPATLEQ